MHLRLSCKYAELQMSMAYKPSMTQVPSYELMDQSIIYSLRRAEHGQVKAVSLLKFKVHKRASYL